MSRPTLKSHRRHPEAARETFEIAHVTVELAPDARTFALIAGQAVQAKDRKPIFTGHLDPAMPAQLRALADRIAEVLP